MFTPLLRFTDYKVNPHKTIQSQATMSIILNRHNIRLNTELNKREVYPPRNNILVKLLAPFRTDWDMIDMVRQSELVGFSSPNRNGKILYNVFHRSPVKEFIIADADGSDGDLAEIVDVIYYPFSGIVPPLPNGRDNKYPEAFAIYSINLPKLLNKYKEYLLEVNATNGVKDIRYFIFKNITQPLLTRLIDISIFNTYLYKIGNIPLPTVEAKADKYYLQPYSVSFNNLVKKVLKQKIGSNITTDDLFNRFILPYSSGADVAKISNIVTRYPRFHWVAIYSLLYKVLFMKHITDSNIKIHNFEMEYMLLQINTKRVLPVVKQFAPPIVVQEITNFLQENK